MVSTEIYQFAELIYQQIPEIANGDRIIFVEINVKTPAIELSSQGIELKDLAQAIIDCDIAQKFENGSLLTSNEAAEYAYIISLKKMHDQLVTKKSDRVMQITILKNDNFVNLSVVSEVSLDSIANAIASYFVG